MSQSIKSDRISESRIARIAGNIMSGLAGGASKVFAETKAPDETYIEWSVRAARAIAAEVERTAILNGTDGSK